MSLAQLWSKRKARKRRQKLERGFGYALTEYLLNEVSLSSLEDKVDMARTFDDYDDFDRGIEIAISAIEKWEAKGLMHVTRLRLCLKVGDEYA